MHWSVPRRLKSFFQKPAPASQRQEESQARLEADPERGPEDESYFRAPARIGGDVVAKPIAVASGSRTSVSQPPRSSWEVVDVIDAGMDAWPLASPHDPKSIREQRAAAVAIVRRSRKRK